MSSDVRDESSPAGEPVAPLTDAEARRVLSELAVEAGGIGTFDWDLTTGRLLWDERLLTMFGYEAGAFDETIAGFTARLHPEDVDRVSAEIAAAVDAVGILDTEYRIVLPDGQVRYLGARGRALAGVDGRAARLLGAAYDMTARREGQVQLERVLESMSTAFFTLDPDWRFTYVNSEAEHLLGLARERLVGAVVWALFPAAVGSVFESSYRRTMSTGEPTSFDAHYPAPLDAWYEVRAWRNLDGVAVSFLDITARRRLQEQADQEARRGRLLGHVMEQLLGTVDPGEAARRLARLLVADLADWAVVTLTGDEGIAGSRRGLVEVASAHRDPALSALVQEYAVSRLPHLPDLTVVAGAMEGGEPQVIQHDAGAEVMRMLGPGRSRDLMAQLAPDAVVVLPLIGSSGAVGILSLCRDAGHGPFPDDALVTAAHVAGRAGLALDNTRLYRRQRRLAEGLQRSLLTEPAQPEHLQVAVRYVAAAESAQVGGDWYDFFLQSDGSSVIAIGDVLGHDTEAAAAMGQVRSMLRGIALTGAAGSTGPADVLRGLDRAMTSLDLSTTATAVVARLSPPAGPQPSATVLTWANAGHPPPLVVGADGTVAQLATPANDLLLGVLPDAPRTEHGRVLDPGATVLLYTDGLVERRGQSIDDGLARLGDLLAVPGTHLLGLEDLCDRIMSRLVDPTPQDDVALVAVRLAARGT